MASIEIPADQPPLSYLAFTLPARAEEVTADDVLDRFLTYVKLQGMELYPAQEEAILEIVSGKNVVLNTPTGSGKSLVAAAMHFLAYARQQKSWYTAPTKALVNEKFFTLCKAFGPANVGLLTGDASVNRDAPLVCCTAEILANMALREGTQVDARYVVIDEFHYYSDRDRGTAWQIPLLTLPQATFLLMSATLGDPRLFQERLTRLNGLPTAVVQSSVRPVPLDWEYRETPLHETVLDLMKQERVPVYLVCFTQRGCAEEAQNLMSYDYCTKEHKRAIAQALQGVRFDTPYGKEVQRFVRHGIGLHHGGLLPKYRRGVERLAQRGLLKIIVGTDTLGVGVNIPIRTVLLTKLCKYDGQKTVLLSARDFHQIAGRAGRKGFDDRGSVVVQAPEHVIENLRMENRAGSDPSRKRKIVRKKPPEKGYLHWDRAVFQRLVAASPEPLVSRFQVSHGMIVNVLQRGRSGCRALARIIRDCHQSERDRRTLGRTAILMFRSLLDAGIIQVDDAQQVIVHADLQEDFSLNRTLSLFLVEVLDALDRESPTYALDLLTLVESILENPEYILMRQLDWIKQQKLAELKAAGVEFQDRIEQLDLLEYPKPNAEFIYEAFNAFARKHPWVGHENIRPKSIAREMYEQFSSFRDYEKDYGLERSEGLLLRYLSDVYKTLVQTVPNHAKTQEVDDIVTFLGAIVRSIDSSLLDEWEQMQVARETFAPSPDQESVLTTADRVDITTDQKGFTVLVRNALFSALRAVSRGEFDAAASLFEGGLEPVAGDWIRRQFEPFFQEHAAVRIDPVARSPRNTRLVSEDAFFWRVEQIVCDPEQADDWVIQCRVDLERSRDAGHPVLCLDRIGT
jgi:superfamily II RNA helicase